MATILAIVQAEQDGQIESKMIKARQLEAIREARRVEAEKKEADRRSELDDVKDSLRRKRKRGKPADKENENNISDVAVTGTKAAKPKSKKRVSFAE